MRHVEYWLLDLLHDDWACVCALLLNQKDLQSRWNRNARGIMPERVINALQSLYSQNYVSFIKVGEEPISVFDPSTCSIVFDPSTCHIIGETEIEVLWEQLNDWRRFGDKSIGVCVTIAGAQRWERESCFDWRAYSYIRRSPNRDGESGISRVYVDAISVDKLLWELEHLIGQHGVVVDSDTIVIEHHAPFKIFWWRTVASGWRLHADSRDLYMMPTEDLDRLEGKLAIYIARLRQMDWSIEVQRRNRKDQGVVKLREDN